MDFANRPDEQRTAIQGIHNESLRENAPNNVQEDRNFSKYTGKLLNNTYKRNRPQYTQNRMNLTRKIGDKNRRLDETISETERALVTRQRNIQRQLLRWMNDTDVQRQLNRTALEYCKDKSANTIEQWVLNKVQELNLLQDGQLSVSEYNGGHPAYPSELRDWTILRASGDQNNCMIHSILTFTSPTFQGLSDISKNNVADLFRKGPFLDIPNLTEAQKERVRTNVFLDDTDLLSFLHCYKINLMLIAQFEHEGERIRQVIGYNTHLDQPVYIMINEENTHYEPLQNLDGTLFMKYDEAVALAAKYVPGAEVEESESEYESETDSETVSRDDIITQISTVDAQIQTLEEQIKNKTNEFNSLQGELATNRANIINTIKEIYKTKHMKQQITDTKRLTIPLSQGGVEALPTKISIENMNLMNNKTVLMSFDQLNILFRNKFIHTQYESSYNTFIGEINSYKNNLTKQDAITDEIENAKDKILLLGAKKRELQAQLASLTGELPKGPEFNMSLKAKEERLGQALQIGQAAADAELQRIEQLGEKRSGAYKRDQAMEVAVKAVLNADLAANPNEGREIAEYVATIVGTEIATKYRAATNPIKTSAKSLSLSVKRNMIEVIPALQEPLIGRSFIDFLKKYKLNQPVMTDATYADRIRVESETRQLEKQRLQQQYTDYEANKQDGILRPDRWQRELWNPQDGTPIPGGYPEKVDILTEKCKEFMKSQEPPINTLLGIDYGLNDDSNVYDFIQNVFLNPLVATDDMVSYCLTGDRTPGCDAYEILAMLFVLFGGMPHINPRDGGNYTFCDKIEGASTINAVKFLPKYGNLHLLLNGGVRATSQNGKSDVTLFLNEIIDPKRREELETTDLPNKKVYKMSVKFFDKEISQEKYDIEGLSVQKINHIPPEHMGIIAFVKDRGAFIQKCRDVKSGRYGTIEVCEKIYGWEQNVKPLIHDVRNAFFATATKLSITPIELFKDIFDIP